MLTVNKYTVHDSFTFAKEVTSQNGNFFMASLDIDSLFSNILLYDTIDICTDLCFRDCYVYKGFSRNTTLFKLATKQSYFIFNNKLYQQIDGIAMGSPLGPTLANIFLRYHKMKWLESCPQEFKPVYYKRYVDDIFVLFWSPKHLPRFHSFK